MECSSQNVVDIIVYVGMLGAQIRKFPVIRIKTEFGHYLNGLCPNPFSNFDDQAELGLLIVNGDRISSHRAGEATLRAQAKLIQIDIGCGIVDAPPQIIHITQKWFAEFRDREQD